MTDNEKLLEHIQKMLEVLSIQDYEPTPKEIEQRDKFYEYVNEQYAFINKIAETDMDKAQILLNRLRNRIRLYL